MDKSSRLLGISKSNAYLQYLAYHQGQAGFKTGAYKTKTGLLKVAKKQRSIKKNLIGNSKMHVALKLGLTRLTCVYNVLLVRGGKEVYKWMNPPKKENLDQLIKN